MEIWKSIKGYEGLYEVSNLGNVKSLEREVNHYKGGKRLKKEKNLKTQADKDGYYRVVLYNSKLKLKNFSVHQLVAIAFLNHIPNGNSFVVNHIDFNKKNNNIKNLEIISNRKNTNKKHLKSSSKYVGVSYLKRINKFQAEIHNKGERYYLGVYFKEIDAHNAYQKKLKEIESGK